jgi:CRISPR-associated protein Cas1
MSVIYINEQGGYLRKRGGCFVVTKKDETLFSVPEASVDEIVILGNVQISTQAMSELMANGVEVIFLSMNGKFKGILEPGYPKNVFMRISQYNASIEEKTSFNIALWIVRKKIESELDSLRKWRKNRWIESGKSVVNSLNSSLKDIDSKTNIQEIMGIEGITAKLYFSLFMELIPPPFQWNGRNRQPPQDPPNALLSLTYMMTLGEIISKCYIYSLDPYIGFLHQLDYSRPSFALDILELCRSTYCDHFVISLLQKEVFDLNDFYFSEKEGCRLKSEAFREYLDQFHSLRISARNRQPSLETFISSIIERIRNSFKTGILDASPV